MIPAARGVTSRCTARVAGLALFAGESIGIMPDATLYYAARPPWLDAYRYAAEALDWVVAQNEAPPDGEKIRVVSFSRTGQIRDVPNADLCDAAWRVSSRPGFWSWTVDGAGVKKDPPCTFYPAVLLPGMTDNPRRLPDRLCGQ